MRTSPEPAGPGPHVWRTVPRVSAVSVLVIDCTTMGRVAADNHAADVDGDGGSARGERAGHGLTATRVVCRTLACPSRQLRIGADRPDRHCVAGGQAAAAGCGPGFAPILRSAWRGLSAGLHAQADQGFRPPRRAARRSLISCGRCMPRSRSARRCAAGDTADAQPQGRLGGVARLAESLDHARDRSPASPRSPTRPSHRCGSASRRPWRPSMADSVIDRYVTPENLPVLLGYRRIYRGTVQPGDRPPRSRRRCWPARGCPAARPRPVRQLLVQGPPRSLPVALPLRARGGGQAPPRPALRRHAGAQGLGVEADRPHRCRRRPLSRTVALRQVSTPTARSSFDAQIPASGRSPGAARARLCGVARLVGVATARGRQGARYCRASSAGSTGRSCAPTSSARSPPTCKDDTKSPDAGFLGKAVQAHARAARRRYA